MTFIYVGSVLNPVAHLHGLPVMVVNQDRGADVGGHHVNEGETVVNALTRTTAVSSRLGLSVATLKEAEAVMDRGGAYATVVIPRTFTDSLLEAASGAPATASSVPAQPAVQLLENVPSRQSRSQPGRRRPHPGVPRHLDPRRRGPRRTELPSRPGDVLRHGTAP